MFPLFLNQFAHFFFLLSILFLGPFLSLVPPLDLHKKLLYRQGSENFIHVRRVHNLNQNKAGQNLHKKKGRLHSPFFQFDKKKSHVVSFFMLLSCFLFMFLLFIY